MLSPGALARCCEEIDILPHAGALIDQIRRSDPVRRVGGGRSNASELTGMTADIQTRF
jgi:hypothetical protein